MVDDSKQPELDEERSDNPSDKADEERLETTTSPREGNRATGETPATAPSTAPDAYPESASEEPGQGEGRSRRRSTPLPPPGEGGNPFRRIERMVPDMLRRGLEKGIEASLSTWERNLEPALGKTSSMPGALRDALADGKLPKELASAFFTQIDDTKNGVLRVVAREFREFLEATDLAGEIKSALTSLSFEIRTEVRFIPNDAGSVRPQVKARGKVKQKDGSEAGRDRKRGSQPPELDEDTETDD